MNIGLVSHALYSVTCFPAFVGVSDVISRVLSIRLLGVSVFTVSVFHYVLQRLSIQWKRTLSEDYRYKMPCETQMLKAINMSVRPSFRLCIIYKTVTIGEIHVHVPICANLYCSSTYLLIKTNYDFNLSCQI